MKVSDDYPRLRRVGVGKNGMVETFMSGMLDGAARRNRGAPIRTGSLARVVPLGAERDLAGMESGPAVVAREGTRRNDDVRNVRGARGRAAA